MEFNQQATNLLVIALVFFIGLSLYFYISWIRCAKALSKANEELSESLSLSRKQKEKIKSLELATDDRTSKPVSMYRKPVTSREIASGYDYIFLESFASYRKAEKRTGIARFRISSSVENLKFIKHPKRINTMVVFAPVDNELNSSEK